jgi:cardiolipin synthase
MSSDVIQTGEYTWLNTGNEAFPAMLAAIVGARHSVALETYIFKAGAPGDRFREALVRSCRRGVRVRVLLDGLGSHSLPASFWDSLQAAGGQVRYFNPLSLERLGIRDHRKLLVCDNEVAFVGGFNIAPEYEGDGVHSGWRDVGLRLKGPLVPQLAASFDEMFERAEFRHKRFVLLRKSNARRTIQGTGEQLLLSGPARGGSPIKAALRRDLAAARSVRIMVAYFLPTWRLRRHLFRVARSGGRVQLLLAGKSDVRVSQLAGQSLYGRFLRAGVEIYEYQPQILHAKLLIIDDAVYVGSANLDHRSLNINYELMLRFERPGMAREASELFEQALQHSKPVTRESWRSSVSFWQRLKQHWAYLILVRLDSYIARWQWRALPD